MTAASAGRGSALPRLVASRIEGLRAAFTARPGTPAVRAQPWIPPGPVLAVAVGMAYFGIAQYVLWLNDPTRDGAGYWPVAGMTLAVLLLVPRSRWAWVALGVAAAELGGNLWRGYSVEPSLWWTAGNTIEPLVGAALLVHFGRGGRLVPARDLFRFVLGGVVIGPLVGAAIGSVGIVLVSSSSYGNALVKWWVGDGLGVLVVAPLLLCFREPVVQPRSRVETAVIAGVVAIAAPVAFWIWQPDWDAVLPYVVFPIVTLAGVRFGIRGAAISGFFVAEVANLFNAVDYGPFDITAGPRGHDITVLQVFLGSALLAGLFVAAMVTDLVNRTRLYEGQRSVADALQSAVVPNALPDVRGLRVAARYQPVSAADGVRIGGDWYDAVELPDGSVAFVIGDVAGHDVPAGIVMGQLRNGVRSLLFVMADPSEILAALDRQVASDGGTLTTLIVAVYRDGRLRWASAGHPPLLLAPAVGEPRYLDDEPGPPIGAGIAGYVTRSAEVEPGAVVIGFTDGLIEHRSWSLDDGLASVRRLSSDACTIEPDTLCDLLLADTLGDRQRDDDACVLVFRRDPAPFGDDLADAVGAGSA